MNIDPNYLPSIPTTVRQWIYLIFLLIFFAFLGIDAFWETGDPWWLPGSLRVLDLAQIFIMGVVLAHTRKTVAEQIKKAQEKGEPLPAAFQAVPVTSAVPVEEMAPGELGHPDHLVNRPATRSIHDDQLDDNEDTVARRYDDPDADNRSY